MTVLDASVIYKWYATEEGSETALQMLKGLEEGDEIAVPDLALYEIANALRCNHSHSDEDVNRILDHLDALELDIVLANIPLLKEATRLAGRHRISVYDAVYAALAQSLGCDFVTADKKLHRKLSSLAFVRAI